MNKSLYSRYFLILIGLYTVFAVSSQSLLDVAMTLIGAGWVLWAVKSRKFGLSRIGGAEWPLGLYVLIVICGFIFNAPKEAPWHESLLRFTWIFNLYILTFAFTLSAPRTERILQFLSVIILPPTIYSLISYYHGVDLITGRDNARITGLVNSSTYHAHGNAVIFVFLTSLLVFAYRKLSVAWQFVCSVSIVLLGTSIFLTLTRGIWLSIAISAVLMASFIRWKRAFKLLFFLGILFSGLYWTFAGVRDRMAVPVGRDGSASERVNLLKVNYQMWREYPWLGIGHGENIRRNREYWDRPEWNMPQGYITSHAHNQYLNVLATTGVFGFIAFMCFFSFFLIKNIKLLIKASHNKTSINYALLFACLWAQIEFWLACLTDVSFEYAKIRALLILVWALVIALEKSAKEMTGEEL